MYFLSLIYAFSWTPLKKKMGKGVSVSKTGSSEDKYFWGRVRLSVTFFPKSLLGEYVYSIWIQIVFKNWFPFYSHFYFAQLWEAQ